MITRHEILLAKRRELLETLHTHPDICEECARNMWEGDEDCHCKMAIELVQEITKCNIFIGENALRQGIGNESR